MILLRKQMLTNSDFFRWCWNFQLSPCTSTRAHLIYALITSNFFCCQKFAKKVSHTSREMYESIWVANFHLDEWVCKHSISFSFFHSRIQDIRMLSCGFAFSKAFSQDDFSLVYNIFQLYSVSSCSPSAYKVQPHFILKIGDNFGPVLCVTIKIIWKNFWSLFQNRQILWQE